MKKLLAPPIEASRATELVQRGLPWHEIEFLSKELDVTLGELAELVGISAPTFFRRRRAKRFTTDESDHIMRFARLWSLALDVFGNETGARTWLKEEAFGLGGRIPLQVAKTETGAREVETLLHRIDYGVAL
jgi:putative toxin-antitoxin system antitoxin component (TIGR02293 family)